MFVKNSVRVGLKDIGISNKVTNKAILGMLEDVAGFHSDIAGYGVGNIEQTHLSWILLGWKVEIIQRPKYGEKLEIVTWSRGVKRIYAYRDFEIYNDKKELIAKATSKWVLIDINKGRMITITDEIADKYEKEEKKCFEEEPAYKIEEPENYEHSGEYSIKRSVIDVNKHVHNINYINIAYEALPEEIYNSEEFNNFEIVYKKEIKYGENVKCLYGKKDGKNIIVIKDENEEKIHACVKLF